MFTEHVHSRSDKRDATRSRVLAVAEQLFRDQGYDATTIRSIAAAAGVSVGTVMAVGDKAALLVAIFDGWIAEVHAHRAPALPASPDLGATEEVVTLVMPFIDYFASDAELSREYAAVLMRGAAPSVVFTDLALSLIGELVLLLERRGFTRPDAEAGAGSLYFIYLGVLMASSSGALDRTHAEEQFRSAVTFALTHHGGTS